MNLTHVQFRGRSTHAAPDVRHRSPRRLAQREGDPSVTEPQTPVTRPSAPSIASGLPAVVLAQAGLDPAAYRRGPLERRVGACLRALRVDSEKDGLTRLAAAPETRRLALSTLLIGVSGFFRDAPVFEIIRTAIIRALRERPRPIRVWSIGCANGAELYSLAMLLADANLLDRADLLGTDCRVDAVASAAAGVFSTEALADMSESMRSRFFERSRGGWQVVSALRRATTWQVADATREMADGTWDLVLCRNVVIYLQAAASAALFQRIAERLSPGGFLVVGKAERPPAGLGLTASGRCVYVGR